ncbi:unnamed protein product [Didymodactylos carnosus]|uniref:Uncharacterized protein n=1 Tax=Didymodactylos carnosus TaxID=1234261 RepID=A0A8S2MIZ0_9BILA|nr:unnamed protein product [Didymodactylos carnosus]CAF3952729.1 unnamed protein product [Didymodactylos carnosus]
MLSNDSTDSDEGSSSDSEEEIDDDNEHTSSIKRSKMEYKTLNIGSRNRQQSDSDVLERPSDNESSDNEDQENENEEEYQRSLFHRNRNDTQKSNERLQPYYSRTLGRYNDSSVLDPVESFEERSPRKSVSATKSISHDEATLLDIMKKPNERYKYYTNIDDEPNAAETEYDEFYRTKSVDPSTDTQSKSADFSAWINRFQSLPDLDASFELNHTAFRENIPSSPLGSPKMISGSRIDTITTIINGASQQAKSSPVKQQQQSKIPIRPPSLSQSRSRSRSPSHSPTTRKKTMNDANNADRTIRRQTSPTSKIPVLIKTQQQPPIEKVFPKNDLPVTEKGAFHFFTSNEKLNDEPIVSNIFEKDETHNKEQNSKVTASSFLPINHKKTAVETKQSTNSTAYRFPTRNAISANGSYKSKTTTNVTTDLTMIDPRRLTSQQYSLDDSDDTLSIENESATELVMKLKEEKRHCKKTVTILNQLHENYGQLLEKYAQAENTIDQLRFQPKLYDNSTPPANTIEVSDVYSEA